jgi:cytochrome b561
MGTATTAQVEKYNKVAIALHWIIAVLMVFMLTLGEDLIELRKGESLSAWGPSAHASLGILVLALSVLRIVWRIMNPAPPLPPMPAWQVKATAAIHGMLYLLMLAIPLFGWLALAPYGAERLDADSISFFRLFSLNVLPNLGEWTGEAHEITGNLAKILIIIHVLAALKHQFIDKDNLLRRMTFR